MQRMDCRGARLTSGNGNTVNLQRGNILPAEAVGAPPKRGAMRARLLLKSGMYVYQKVAADIHYASR
jgi:hypothetical protein